MAVAGFDLFIPPLMRYFLGDGWVAERFNAPVLKTGGMQVLEGSNPSPSAKRHRSADQADAHNAAFPWLQILLSQERQFEAGISA